MHNLKIGHAGETFSCLSAAYSDTPSMLTATHYKQHGSPQGAVMKPQGKPQAIQTLLLIEFDQKGLNSNSRLFTQVETSNVSYTSNSSKEAFILMFISQIAKQHHYLP